MTASMPRAYKDLTCSRVRCRKSNPSGKLHFPHVADAISPAQIGGVINIYVTTVIIWLVGFVLVFGVWNNEKEAR